MAIDRVAGGDMTGCCRVFRSWSVRSRRPTGRSGRELILINTISRVLLYKNAIHHGCRP